MQQLAGASRSAARAEAITDPQPAIRIHPERIIGWGLDDPDHRNARNVPSR